MDKYNNLEEEIKKCRKCHLRDTCIQVVPGEGRVDADVMFIGEGPGENEDKQDALLLVRLGNF